MPPGFCADAGSPRVIPSSTPAATATFDNFTAISVSPSDFRRSCPDEPACAINSRWLHRQAGLTCRSPEGTNGRTTAMFEGFTRTEIQTSGARIHLRHGGDGPPLPLLHGNPLTHVSWHRIANRLAEHFHVVATDLRGYGDSVGPEDGGPNNINYSFRAMAQ